MYLYITRAATRTSAQAVGQLTYIRPFVADFSPDWLASNVVALTAGAMMLVHVSAAAGGAVAGGWERVCACACVGARIVAPPPPPPTPSHPSPTHPPTPIHALPPTPTRAGGGHHH